MTAPRQHALQKAGPEDAGQGKHRDEELASVGFPEVNELVHLHETGHRHEDNRRENRLGEMAQQITEETRHDCDQPRCNQTGKRRARTAHFR